jgi:thiol-disulfide isomerase/thioredoxin
LNGELPLRATLADPEELEKEAFRDSAATTDDSSSTNSWTPSQGGGFFPNIQEHLLRRRRQQRPRNQSIQQVLTMEEYKEIVVDCRDKITVVRFYAPWCRACKATEPQFQKLARSVDERYVQFVQVPLTQSNAFLHQGLGIPSLPYGHIYHPAVGLTEECKISKEYFDTFRQIVDTYVKGYCDVTYEDDLQ